MISSATNVKRYKSVSLPFTNHFNPTSLDTTIHNTKEHIFFNSNMYYKLISFITINVLKYHRTVLAARQLLIGIHINININLDLNISTCIWYPDKPYYIYI